MQVTAYNNYHQSSENAYYKRKTNLRQNASSLIQPPGPGSKTILTGVIAGGVLLALLAARFLHYGWVALWAMVRKT